MRWRLRCDAERTWRHGESVGPEGVTDTRVAARGGWELVVTCLQDAVTELPPTRAAQSPLMRACSALPSHLCPVSRVTTLTTFGNTLTTLLSYHTSHRPLTPWNGHPLLVCPFPSRFQLCFASAHGIRGSSVTWKGLTSPHGHPGSGPE